jgi:hypothetical protein
LGAVVEPPPPQDPTNRTIINARRVLLICLSLLSFFIL